jgi:hypothetical protein
MPDEYATINYGETYKWDKHPAYQALTEAKTYFDTAHYTFGCDSVYYTLHLEVIPPVVDSTYQRCICPNTEYTDLYFSHLNTSNTYTTTRKYHNTNYDSVQYILHLTVLPYAIDSAYTKQICKGNYYNDPYFSQLTDADTYTATRKYYNTDCDSVRYILTLNLLEPFTDNKTATICQSESLTWHDTTLTSKGHYEKHYIDQYGCDSTYIIDLDVLNNSLQELTLKVCEGETYPFSDTIIATEGTYTRHYNNYLGCDSTIILHFSVGSETEMTIAETFCQGSFYDFAGQQLDKEGTYQHTFTREGKCDSTVYLTLTMEPAPVIHTEQTINHGETYLFAGTELSQSGLYRDTTYEDGTHCMMIEELLLTVLTDTDEPEPLHVEAAADNVCANDNTLSLTVTTISGAPHSLNIAFSEQAKQRGWRDSTNLIFNNTDYNTFHINVPHGEDSTKYVRPDTYSLTLHITDTDNNTADTTILFDVLYPSWLIVQRWNDVLMMTNEHHNGGYVFSDIRWYNNDQPLTARGEHNGYIYETLDLNGNYWAELTRADDGKTYRTCEYTPTQESDLTTLKTEINIAQRHNGNFRRVRVIANCSGNYIVYSIDGKQCFSGRFGSDYGEQDILFDTAVPAGTYIIRFTTDNGYKTTKKWMVR